MLVLSLVYKFCDDYRTERNLKMLLTGFWCDRVV